MLQFILLQNLFYFITREISFIDHSCSCYTNRTRNIRVVVKDKVAGFFLAHSVYVVCV